ncbi:MAG TPA: NERD domain-containing protein [Tetragenococcus sp.]|nr:NERD domain-containing protein [Tetragenococcus sp.]
MRQKPHELQYLEVLHQRNGLTYKEEKEYHKQLKGYLGEKKIDDWCDKHLSKEIHSMADITIGKENRETQIDKLIAGDFVLYHIEIKNYEGHYCFRNNQWTINGKILANNLIEQSRRSVRMTQQFLNEAAVNLKVVGIIMFVNNNVNIEIIDDVSEVILTYDKICPWLAGIVPFDAGDWQAALQNYKITKRYNKYITTPKRFANLTKGIRCPNCNSFKEKEKSRSNLICPNCGYVEPKIIANTRTICEYGLIMHHLPLKKKGIKELMGADFNSRYVTKVLHQCFQLIPNKKVYKNKGICFENWFYEQLELFRKMYRRRYWK